MGCKETHFTHSINDMLKYNEQCLTAYQADKIGKPNKVNGLMTVGTIADLSEAVTVVIKPANTMLPEKRISTTSDGAGLVVATIPAALLEWFRPGETYYIMIMQDSTGDLYDFTASGGPSGNALEVTTLHECEDEDFTLKTRTDAACLTC